MTTPDDDEGSAEKPEDGDDKAVKDRWWVDFGGKDNVKAAPVVQCGKDLRKTADFDRLARTQLCRSIDRRLREHGDDGIASGDRVVSEEHHGVAVRRELDRAPDQPFAG